MTNSKEVVIKNLPVLFARMAVGKIVELEPQLGNGEKFTVKVNDGSRSTGTCKGVILNTQGQMLHGEMNGSCYIQTKVYEMLF
ncbi:hypothetical protein [Chitinophaga skermanii]|uniref:hypothetical protein n=1 Tax=Chitinophaga skermanii TaxID=331697 RepID=UPI0011E5FC78|nr:hypothetical protein [Chitinophaga skermanii]